MPVNLQHDQNKNPFVEIVTPVGRLFYATLETPRAAQPGAKPKFSVRLLLDPDQVGEISEAIYAVAEARFAPENGIDPRTGQPALLTPSARLQMGLLHVPLRDGNTLFATDPVKFALFQNKFYLNAGTDEDKRPFTLDTLGKQMDAAKIWRGCKARLRVICKAYETAKQDKNRGITFYLSAVQFAGGNIMTDKLAGDGADRAAAAFASAGALPADPGFGVNTAGMPQPPVGGFAAPPGVHVPAAPPAYAPPPAAPAGGGYPPTAAVAPPAPPAAVQQAAPPSSPPPPVWSPQMQKWVDPFTGQPLPGQAAA